MLYALLLVLMIQVYNTDCSFHLLTLDMYYLGCRLSFLVPRSWPFSLILSPRRAKVKFYPFTLPEPYSTDHWTQKFSQKREINQVTHHDDPSWSMRHLSFCLLSTSQFLYSTPQALIYVISMGSGSRVQTWRPQTLNQIQWFGRGH